MKRISLALLAATALMSSAMAKAPRDPCAVSEFDDAGVAVFDYGDHYVGRIGRQYVPTHIAQVANECLARWKAQKRPDDWRLLTAQIAWLRSHAVLIGDHLAAYEHPFPWNYGLQPGWRSGSAQSTAIRVMIRYYRETGDGSILPLIRRIKNLMMLPVSEGGTLARTPEGGIWIEEFPSSPPSLVLGGAIDAVYALHEFAELFPDDTQARTDFDSAVGSFKASLRHYDDGRWVYTDRYPRPAAQPPAHDNYGELFPALLKGLYEITADPALLATSLRWGSFFEQTPLLAEGNVRRDGNGVYRLVPGPPKRALEDALQDSLETVSAPEAIEGFGADKLFDADIDTYFGAAAPGAARIDIRLKRPKVVNTLRFSLYNIALYPTEIDIQIKPEGSQEFESVAYERELLSRRHIYYRFNAARAKELRVVATRFSEQGRLVISGLALGKMDWQDRAAPASCNYTTPAIRLATTSFRVAIDAPAESAKEMFVIYRRADDSGALQSSPWQWDAINPFQPHEIAATDGVYQFRVLCTREAGQRGWKGLTVLDRDNRVAYRE